MPPVAAPPRGLRRQVQLQVCTSQGAGSGGEGGRYSFPQSPRHLGAYVDKFNYRYLRVGQVVVVVGRGAGTRAPVAAPPRGLRRQVQPQVCTSERGGAGEGYGHYVVGADEDGDDDDDDDDGQLRKEMMMTTIMLLI